MGSDSGASCPTAQNPWGACSRIKRWSAAASSFKPIWTASAHASSQSAVTLHPRDWPQMQQTMKASSAGLFGRAARIQESSEALTGRSSMRKVCTVVYTVICSWGMALCLCSSRLHSLASDSQHTCLQASLIGEWLATHVFPSFSHWSATPGRQHLCPSPLGLHSPSHQFT